MSERLKNGVKDLVGQAVLESLIKTMFCTISLMTQDLLAY